MQSFVGIVYALLLLSLLPSKMFDTVSNSVFTGSTDVDFLRSTIVLLLFLGVGHLCTFLVTASGTLTKGDTCVARVFRWVPFTARRRSEISMADSAYEAFTDSFASVYDDLETSNQIRYASRYVRTSGCWRPSYYEEISEIFFQLSFVITATAGVALISGYNKVRTAYTAILPVGLFVVIIVLMAILLLSWLSGLSSNLYKLTSIIFVFTLLFAAIPSIRWGYQTQLFDWFSGRELALVISLFVLAALCQHVAAIYHNKKVREVAISFISLSKSEQKTEIGRDS